MTEIQKQLAYTIKMLETKLNRQSKESEEQAKAYQLQLNDLQEQLETMQQQLLALLSYVEINVSNVNRALGLEDKPQ
jgi:lipid II:glycine glycyltransferase (peptidoglycan interpeptide bridge formation enzyme)